MENVINMSIAERRQMTFMSSSPETRGAVPHRDANHMVTASSFYSLHSAGGEIHSMATNVGQIPWPTSA